MEKEKFLNGSGLGGEWAEERKRCQEMQHTFITVGDRPWFEPCRPTGEMTCIQGSEHGIAQIA